MKKILPRICFLGCGAIAHHHSKILRKLYPKIELCYASREVSKSKKMAEIFKGSNYFGSYEEALCSDYFDIAFITTPHSLHAELAVRAAENKKDIIIEKPITRNLKEFAMVEKAVKNQKVRCVVAENYYYKPAIARMRKWIEAGLIGKVLCVEITKTNKDVVTGWRTDREIMGGGALLEGGVHWINALHTLAGALPTGAIAFMPTVAYETNIPYEDTMLVIAEFENGVVGKLFHSWRIPNRFRGMGLSKIYGTDGVITFESNGLYASLYGKKKQKKIFNPFRFLGFHYMHRAFIENYIAGQPWRPDLERIKVEMKLIEAAYRSLKSRKFEKL
ncbi:MAG: Gfo/Idh/MocA family oxidoreductase [Spirochaetes bacterium]|nr:Gfo/Idh/MocA family oxidoreductase [Spirochaetota bacterium]